MKTVKRKSEHLDICLKKDVQFKCKTTGLEWIDLNYECLPEISLNEVDLSTNFLGKKFYAPLMVSAITGGTQKAKKINRDIAKACQKLGIGMGLGSQRAMLEKPALKETYYIRDIAPGIFLAGNIGVAQLKGYSAKQIAKAMKEIGADALCVHVNAAQEAMQFEGDTNFKRGIAAINKLTALLKKPVIVKEVGHGISGTVARKLAKTGISALDVQGAGGTSWIGIDSLRGKSELGETFWDFGVPTAASIVECRQAFKGKIIGSGGIRTGQDVAKALLLGADLCGIALPVLKAQAKGGEKGVEKYLRRIIEETRVAFYLTGAKNISDIKKTK